MAYNSTIILSLTYIDLIQTIIIIIIAVCYKKVHRQVQTSNNWITDFVLTTNSTPLLPIIYGNHYQ